MAKRTTRQRQVDKIEAAIKAQKRAEDLMAQAIAVYAQQGAYIGAQLDLIRQGQEMCNKTLERFRLEVM